MKSSGSQLFKTHLTVDIILPERIQIEHTDGKKIAPFRKFTLYYHSLDIWEEEEETGEGVREG